ncbi:MAG: hypothetical protein ACTSXK_01110, partial [Promethearchaeota archaeon]
WGRDYSKTRSLDPQSSINLDPFPNLEEYGYTKLDYYPRYHRFQFYSTKSIMRSNLKKVARVKKFVN